MTERVQARLGMGTGAAVCILLAAVYFAGAQRAVGTGDMAEMVVASYTLGIPHPTGYPIYTWLGKIFTSVPIGGIPLRLTAMSAVFASLTLFLLYAAVADQIAQLTNSTLLKYLCGAVAVVTLGLFRPFWHFAQTSDVYTVNSFLVALFILVFFRWLRTASLRHLCLSSFALGLTLGTHMTNLFLVPLVAGIAIHRRQTLKRLLLCVLWLAAGASQYLYLLVRARQNPAYLHPQAHFFEASTWTGSANPLWNWLWFVSGARWRGHCSTSLGEVVFKARDLGSTILSEYSAVVTAVVVAGAAFLLWRTRTALRTISLIWIVLSEIAYYLLYQPSGSGMILPLFFCLSLLAGVGVAAVWYLAAAMSPRRLRSRVLSLSLAAIVAAGSVCAIIPRQRLDYSTQRGPATLVSEMIDKLPRGSVVEGIEWKYEKIVDYFRIVEARDIPFRQGTCDAATIADGRCFILGTQLKAQYLRQGCPLSLYLYVENALPVYRLQKPEDRVP